METVELLSCAPEMLYLNADRYDSEIDLDRLIATARAHSGAIEFVADVYPGGRVSRTASEATIGPEPHFLRNVEETLHHLGQVYSSYPPTILTRIRDAIIWRNMLFAVSGDRVLPIYELYRPTDRAEKGEHLVARLAACERRERLDVPCPLFLGSLGSFNYGHWLVDDLPALAAHRHLSPGGGGIDVVMTSYFSEIDRIRVEGADLALDDHGGCRTHLLDRDVAYRVENLYYVTPNSYHPILKNPEAIKFVRNICKNATSDVVNSGAMGKIFVDRGGGMPRRLLNADSVSNLLTSAGYETFYPERFSLREQWARFAAAEDVIGIMGAAMTNSLLCNPGTRVTHLAPNGWFEPFFWDLAAMADHRYAVIFGLTDDASPHDYRKNFYIDTNLLQDFIF